MALDIDWTKAEEPSFKERCKAVTNYPTLLKVASQLPKPRIGGNSDYCCPNCNSGNLKHGTTQFTLKDSGLFICFSCDIKGDPVELQAIINHIDKHQALREVEAMQDGLPIPQTFAPNETRKKKNSSIKWQDMAKYHDDFVNSPDAQPVREYFFSRGLNMNDAKQWGIGAALETGFGDYGRKWFLVIPTSETSCTLRCIVDNGKYTKPKRGTSHTWNIDALKNTSKPLWIVEGEIDAMAMTKAGANCLGMGSVNRDKTVCNEVISTWPKEMPVVLCLDNDQPEKPRGQEHTKTMLHILQKAGYSVTDYSFSLAEHQVKDPGELWQHDQEHKEHCLADIVKDFKPAQISVIVEDKEKKNSAIVATGGTDADQMQQPEYDYYTFPDGIKLYLSGFSVNCDGISKQTWDAKNKQPVFQPVFEHCFIYPTELLRNDVDNIQQVLVKVCYSETQAQTFQVNRGDLLSPRRIVNLADRGFPISGYNASKAVEYFHRAILDNEFNDNSTLQTFQACPHLGWYKGDFHPYIATNSKLTYEAQQSQLAKAASVHEGSLESYNAIIQRLRNNSLIFQVLQNTAIASFCIKLLGINPFIVHVWSNQGGTGKTAALRAVMAAFGYSGRDRDYSLVGSHNATRAATLSTLSTLANIPYAADELENFRTTASYSIENFIMESTEGRENAKKKDSLSLQRALSWACNILSTGNRDIIDSTMKEGAYGRVISLHIDKENKIVDASTIRNDLDAILDNCGQWGRILACYIAEHQQEIKDDFAGFLTTINEANPSLIHKNKENIAAVMLGQKLANDVFGMTDWQDPNKLIDLCGRDTSETDITERAWFYVVNAINANQSKFTLWQQGKGNFGQVLAIDGQSIIKNNECMGKYDDTKGLLSINKNALDDMLAKKNISFDTIKKAWADNGHLVKTKQGKFVWRDTLGGMGYNGCHLNLPKIEEA